MTKENAYDTIDLETKLDYLRSCCLGTDGLQEPCPEDAAGHLCDLLEWCRVNSVSHDGRMFVNLAAMVAYYGKNPMTIVAKGRGSNAR